MTGASAEQVVWRLAKPLPLHFERQDLYAEYRRAHYLYERERWRLEAGGVLRFDRLLNHFAQRKWRSRTGVTSLSVRARHQGGGCRVSVLGYDGEVSSLLAAGFLPPSKEPRVTRFELPPGMASDLVFLQLDADADAEVDILDIAIVTQAPVRRTVRLGVVVTTFNRPGEVEAQAGVLEGLAEAGVDYEVLVVDNGENLEFARDYDRTRIIPSPNLGGAGGFTRGLMELVECGEATHALFMDDDAFCHPEAIARAVALVRYAKSARLALTAAMNYLHAPDVQYERGGKLVDYGVGSIRQNAQANSLRAAWENEAAETPDYGAWWGFLFPLAPVEELPFPFFVRGDDIAFSLHNRFDLETLPGFVAWQPSFEFKIGAAIEYLAHRSFIALPLVVGEGGPWSKARTLEGVRHAFDAEVDGLRYPIAEAICHALEDVLTGPGFWRNPANTLARMQELGRMEAAFSKASYLPNWIFRPDDVEHRRVMRVLRARFGRLNLPARLCFRRAALTNTMYPKSGQAAFRRGMIYHAPDGSRSLSCRRDWRWRRRLERRFARLTAEFAARFDDLSRDYARGRVELQSPDTWTARFAKVEPELRIAHPAL